MKVKYQQLYSNDCGVCAIKNMMNLYGKRKIVNATLSTQGMSMDQIIDELKEEFFDVTAVSFEINELKKVKMFKPYITLITNQRASHYVVIYKKTKRYVYILDSLSSKSYRLKYEEFSKIDAKKSIIPDNLKEMTYKYKNFQNIVVIPFLSIIETIFILSTTVLLQQIIDNGFKDAILYIIVQFVLLLLATYKTKLFLKTFKELDKSIVLNVTRGVYNLKSKFVYQYDLNEIYYRTFDAYSYKSMILNFIFDIINDLILAILTILLMLKYSYILTLFILLLSLIIVFISIHIFKHSKVLVERKRVSEYNFINTYRDSLKNHKQIYENNDKEYEKNTLHMLSLYQKDDYNLTKLNMKKNLILTYFQSITITLLVVLYFSKFYDLLSIGSLIALINLATLLLQPILSICSQIINFSNFKLIKERLKDIQKNLK